MTSPLQLPVNEGPPTAGPARRITGMPGTVGVALRTSNSGLLALSLAVGAAAAGAPANGPGREPSWPNRGRACNFIADRLSFGPGDGVYHLNYFVQPSVAGKLKVWLKG